MYIQKLKLERFRGAQELSLELDRRLNVFVGMNGAGKSSILDAAAILLSYLAYRFKNPKAGRPIAETDIKNCESSANLEIVFNRDKQCYEWNVAKVRKGHSRKDIASNLGSATRIVEQFQTEITETKEKVNLPLFAYYPVNRAVTQIPVRIHQKHSFDLVDAFDQSLSSGATFRTFFEWFRMREDLENEENRSQVSESPDIQLNAVRRALESFLPGFKNLRVRRNPLRMEVDKNGQKLRVDQLSDGEKCLMAMVGDIARRLAIANPVGNNPLEGEGVILVDEIDMHLHPKWQRMMVPKLKEVFPSCQFLISTHSPHVITHAERKNIFLLVMKNTGLEAVQATESYGKTVERILEDLMGLETTRPDEVQGQLKRIYEQIDRNEFEKAKESIRSLKSHIGDDSELVKARVLIERKELMGK